MSSYNFRDAEGRQQQVEALFTYARSQGNREFYLRGDTVRTSLVGPLRRQPPGTVVEEQWDNCRYQFLRGQHHIEAQEEHGRVVLKPKVGPWGRWEGVTLSRFTARGTVILYRMLSASTTRPLELS